MQLYLFTNAEHPASSDARARVNEHVRHAEMAMNAGFVGVAIGKHLSLGDLQWFPPIPLAAYLAGTVPEARIAPTVTVLPFSDPFLLAEAVAFLDVLTDGRLSIGVAAGWATSEFRALGLRREDRLALFERKITQFAALLDGDEVDVVDGEGVAHTITVGLRPRQKPRPPIWLGAIGPRTARRLAPFVDALIMSAYIPLEQQLQVLQAFRRGQGAASASEPNATMRNVFDGESCEKAIADAMPYLRSSYAAFDDWGLFSEVLNESTDASTFEDTVLSRVIIGDPDDVARGLRLTSDRLGTDRIVLWMQWRGMESSHVQRSLRLLQTDVIPQFSDT